MKYIKLLLLAIIWVFAVWGILQISRIYTADKLSVLASSCMENGEYAKALEYAEESISLNSREPSYYRVRALTYLAFNVLEGNSEYKKKAYEDALRAVDINSDNLVTKRNLVSIYYFLASRDYGITSGFQNQDSDYIEMTKKYFEDLKKDYPNDAGVISIVAQYEKKLGMEKEYGESVVIVRDLRPDLLEWHPSFN